ncbi:MAG TPA: hypothetical protein VFB37_11270 [Steroidobacteraceae bacterium]|nr:hypothetical protein [Steroidobacteraceae bacterium]
MIAPETALRAPVTPGPSGASLTLSLFGLLGGPLAWFAQCCAGYGFSSWACFPKDQRRFAPLEGYGWTWGVVVGISAVAFLIAVGAFLASSHIRQRIDGQSGQVAQLGLPIGLCRTRFLAVWGMAAGGGFAIAIAFTAVALIVLPQCAG